MEQRSQSNIERLVAEGYHYSDNYQSYWVMSRGDKRLFYDLDTDQVLPFIEMSEDYRPNEQN